MGYAFSKMDFKPKNTYLGFILFILILLYVVYLIPIYIMESKMGLIDIAWGPILSYIAINLSISVSIMRGQSSNVPNMLGEAAMIDDRSSWQVFSKIVLPVMRLGITTVIVFIFISVWGEFTCNRTLAAATKTQTLSVGIILLCDEAIS